LQAMNKKITVSLYKEKVNQARLVRQDIAISCDIMVGFPGEDEPSFNNTVNFLKEIKPMRMHIFTFSPREKTKFANLKPANQGVIKQRYNFLKELAISFSNEYKRRFLGKTLYMVVEETNKGLFSGYTENYIKVCIKDKLKLGQIIPVRIDKVESSRIFARRVN